MLYQNYLELANRHERIKQKSRARTNNSSVLPENFYFKFTKHVGPRINNMFPLTIRNYKNVHETGKKYFVINIINSYVSLTINIFMKLSNMLTINVSF